MSAWILPVKHIDAIITTAVLGYKAAEDGPLVRRGGTVDGDFVWGAEEPEYRKGDTVPWYSELLSAGDASGMGQTLANANYRSVNARYGESSRAPRYTYRGTGRVLTLGEMAQAIGSLDYQSCEYDEWYTSKARRFLDRVELRIYHNIPRRTIPGYTGDVHVIE